MDAVPTIFAGAATGKADEAALPPALREYDEGDDPTKPGGLPCRHNREGCKYIGSSWGAILGHERQRHGKSFASLKGTYLYEQGTAELNAKQNARNQAKRIREGTNEPTKSARRSKVHSNEPKASQDKHEHCKNYERAASKLERPRSGTASSREQHASGQEKHKSEEDDIEKDGKRNGEVINESDSLVCSAESSSQGLKEKRKEEISEEKWKLYAQFILPKDEGTPKRLKVDKTAHEFMHSLLKTWQQKNRAELHELPTSSEWYLDARVESIKTGLLTKQHSVDVVRSYLKHYVNAQKKEQSVQASGASAASTRRGRKKCDGVFAVCIVCSAGHFAPPSLKER
tara:strand:+ start:900 stop:1928 length:1029 start_codon:yes stop_codon:yes gene_type:complete